MLKNVLCCAFVLACSVNLALSGEHPKAESKPEAKSEAKPAAAPQVFIPRELQGGPVAKRLTEIQVELDAAMAKRGPARQEADKARQIARDAEHKAELIDRTIASLELEKTRTTNNGIAQYKEFAAQKVAFENSQKISRLETQVRELTAKLEATSKPKVQHASIQKEKDRAPLKKAEPAKKAEEAKKEEPKKDDPKK